MTAPGHGALVLSLDFELRWGVRDHCPRGHPYEGNLMATRAVVRRLLELFERRGIAATWATVGLLFARSAADAEQFRPAELPAYRDRRLDPYADPPGDDDHEAALHFAPDLVQRILDTPRQELATHTFSHFFCAEPGQTAAQFEADLRSAMRIAARAGAQLESIVFPRNQHNPDYDPVLRACGVRAYRGNPSSWMWQFTGAAESATRMRRLARLVDAYVPLTGDGAFGWSEVPVAPDLYDVRASHVVRPFSPRLAALEPLRLRRLAGAMRAAARTGRLIHLWWHPHNFGAHPDRCLAFLESLLDEFENCRDRYGMESLTMGQVARMAARGAPAPVAAGGAGA